MPIKIVALLSAQGTACAETALYGSDDTPRNRAMVEEQVAVSWRPDEADRPLPGTWTDVSDNDALQEDAPYAGHERDAE